MRPVYINLYGNEAIVRAEGTQTNVDASLFVLNLQLPPAFQNFLKRDRDKFVCSYMSCFKEKWAFELNNLGLLYNLKHLINTGINEVYLNSKAEDEVM